MNRFLFAQTCQKDGAIRSENIVQCWVIRSHSPSGRIWAFRNKPSSIVCTLCNLIFYNSPWAWLRLHVRLTIWRHFQDFPRLEVQQFMLHSLSLNALASALISGSFINFPDTPLCQFFIITFGDVGITNFHKYLFHADMSERRYEQKHERREHRRRKSVFNIITMKCS